MARPRAAECGRRLARAEEQAAKGGRRLAWADGGAGIWQPDGVISFLALVLRRMRRFGGREEEEAVKISFSPGSGLHPGLKGL